MPGTVHAQRPTTDTKTEPEHVEPVNQQAKGQELKDDIDAMLDEIDAVLIANAQEFVDSYRQQGGE